jgi:hypothetical protein
MVFLFNYCNLSLQCNEKAHIRQQHPTTENKVEEFCFNIVITGGQAWKIMTKKLRMGATTLLPKREKRERERERERELLT